MTSADWAALAGILAPVILGVFAAVRWDSRNAIQEAIRSVTAETTAAERLAISSFASREQVARLEERIRELSEKIDDLRDSWRAEHNTGKCSV